MTPNPSLQRTCASCAGLPAEFKRQAETEMGANLAAVPEGYSFESSGRSGTVFFRRGTRILALYCEMSGVPEFDMLLWTEESLYWTYPIKERIEESDRSHILAGLEAWLKMKNIRSDAFPAASKK